MRRGLISWSQAELPAATLDARVARLQAAMAEQGLDAVLAYASFAQPAVVQWLSNFIPYWSEALLLITPEGPPQMLVANTPRVHGWIREVAHVGELVAAPDVGREAAVRLDRMPGVRRVGVVALDSLPWSVAAPLLEAGWGDRLADASAAYLVARHPADGAERGLARMAEDIALRSMQAIPANARSTSATIAAVDGLARNAGAEEVLVRITPDLARDATLLRMEGDAPLGDHYAVECAVAYKGVWVRCARSLSRSITPATWGAAARWFAACQAAWQGPHTLQVRQANAPGAIVDWTFEASTGVAPLSVVAGSGIVAAPALPPGSLGVLTVQMRLEGGVWLHSGPVGQTSTMADATAGRTNAALRSAAAA